MSLASVRQAIVNTFATKFTPAGLKTCLPWGGDFNQQELKRTPFAAPAIFVGCTGLSGFEIISGSVYGMAEWVAIVVGKDLVDVNVPSRETRDNVATRFGFKILKILPFQNWGDNTVFAVPDIGSIRSRNLRTTKLDQTGAAMWKTSWSQQQEIDDDDEEEIELFDFLKLGIDYFTKAPDDDKPEAHDEVLL